MFDDNHIDDLMRSVLENGREEVPGHIWDGISKGLDRADRHKTVVLWFRRTAVAAAVAAVVAVGVVLNVGKDQVLVPEPQNSDMIAVVEDQKEDENGLMAYTEPMEITIEPKNVKKSAVEEDIVTKAELEVKEEPMVAEKAAPATIVEQEPVVEKEESAEKKEPEVRADMTESSEWEEDESQMNERRVRTSIVISGIAGTNSPQNSAGNTIMRSPAMVQKYTKTTIEQIGSNISYSIPISAGVGVKVQLAQRWALSVGLNYTHMSRKFEGEYIEVADGVESLPVHSQISNTQHYIGIPVSAYFTIIRKDFVNFYAHAGGAIEKCLDNSFKVMTTPAIHHKEEVKGVQLSANAGIGVEFLLGRHIGLYLDPSLRYYFRNGQPQSIRTAQPLMLGFEVGLRFNL